MSSKIEELERQLAAEKAKLKKSEDKAILQETGFKKGDIVEFLVSEQQDLDGYDYKDIWYKSDILDLKVERGIVFASVRSQYYPINIGKSQMKHFDSNDYALRHSVWSRGLELGDKIQLIVDKPKSTKYEIYEIFKIVLQKGENPEYWYYNDNGHPTTIHKGDYFLTHE
jgi:hypothetical protein